MNVHADRTLSEQAALKKGVSNRCFVEYEIDLSGGLIKLSTPALFKRVLKVGTKFIVIAELVGTSVSEYEVEIMQVAAMTYIPLSAKYIDSVVVSGDKIVHFFMQPKGATTAPIPVTELPAVQLRRPNTPPREEDNLKIDKARLRTLEDKIPKK